MVIIFYLTETISSAIARALRKYYSEDQTLTPHEIEREDK